MKKILVCEDEEVIREFVVINLRRAGYDVTQVGSGEEALEAFERENGNFDIALLDVMMGGIDGFAVCKRLREKSPTMGIIMLSAKSQEMDKVSGLMIGADDYVTKPFSPAELTARVDSIYRRVTMNTGSNAPDGAASSEHEIKIPPFVLDLQKHTLTKNGAYVDLTQVEFSIIELFMREPDKAFERGELLRAVWGADYAGDIKVVDVNIRRLRMKIEDVPAEPKYILTVWGYGYKFGNS